MAKTYFAVLGVAVDASPREIRSAYRRLVKEFHPDRFPGGSGPFMEIQEAYAVLGDATRRREYEQSLEQRPEKRGWGPPSHPPPEPLIPRTSPQQPSWQARPIRSFRGPEPLAAETGPSPARAPYRRNPLTVEVVLSREQAARGGSVAVMIPVRAACPACRGLGGGFYGCPRCAGSGMIRGEAPVRIPFPPGLVEAHAVTVSLAPLGMPGLHLTVCFRPGGV